MSKSNDIRSFRGEYGFLSNFHPCDISYGGLVYGSLESAFQAAKCADLSESVQFQSLGPTEAKRLGRTVKLRSDWECAKLLVLRELVILKFITHPSLLGSLLATGNAVLSEDNVWHDNFYGNCTCYRCRNIQGLNHLGLTLMEFRDQMLHTSSSSNKNNYSCISCRSDI